MKKQVQLIIGLFFLTSLTAYGQSEPWWELTFGDLKYEITSIGNNNFLEVVDYTGSEGHVEIPRSLDGFTVTSIGRGAFKDKELTSVTIPNSVTSIGQGAFWYNELQGHLEIPNSVTSIEMTAFARNQLTSVIIPEGVTIIERTAFAYNQLAGHLEIPNGVTRIEYGAFAHNNLAEVIIPNSVTSIEQEAFNDNDLTSVTLGEKVNSIGDWAFGTNQVTRIRALGSTPPRLGGAHAIQHRGRIHLVVPKNTIQAYEQAWGTDFKSITEIPAVGNTFIADHITYKVTSVLTTPYEVEVVDYGITGGEVAIPSTVNNGPSTYKVTAIGNYAFANNQLTSVTLPNTVTSIGNHAFQYNQLKGHLEIPNNVTSIGSHAFGDNQLTRVTIPGGVTHIGEAAFAVNQLTSVTIPSSLETIPNYAFQNNQLTSVTLPNNLTSIGTHAFQNNQLEHVTLPNNLTSIGNSAFWWNQLEHVTLPGNVTRIDQWAFWDNLNLAMVTVKAESPPTLDSAAFKDRSQIDVIVPRGRRQAYLEDNGWTGFKNIIDAQIGDTFIADHITYEIASMDPNPNTVRITSYDNTTGGPTTVNIPDTVKYQDIDYAVTAIGNNAFKEKLLTRVIFAIPSNVTHIGNNAFQGNELTSVEIPNSVTHIGVGAFVVNKLESVVISSSLTRIEAAVFSHNQLIEVTIPGGVTNIGSNVFTNNSITKITSQATAPPSIQGNTFSNRRQIDVVVPKGNSPGSIKEAYEQAWGTGFPITEGIALSIEGASEIESLSPFDMTFQFARDVTGFTANDISLDHATLSDFTGSGSSYTVKVTPTPCDGTIQVTVPGDIAEYAPNFPNLTAIKTVTINATPSAPVASSPVEYCQGDQAGALTATGDNLLWYTSQAGGTWEATAPMPGTANAGSTTHYVSQTTNGCESDRTPIEVKVKALPEAPTISSTNSSICAGDIAIFTIEGGNQGDVVTYEDGTSTSPKMVPLGEGGSVQVTVREVSSNTTLTLTNITRGDCSTPLTTTTATVTVKALPEAPTISSTNSPVCAGDEAIFTITGGTPGDVVTYEDGTSTSPKMVPLEEGGSVQVTVRGVSSNTTLTLTNITRGDCSTPLTTTTATVTVNARPEAPSVNSSSVEYCQGEEAGALTATGDNLRWYTSATDQTGETTAPMPGTANAGSTTHYVSQTTNGCESDRTPIEVTVNALPEALTISSTNSSICAGDNAIFTIAGGNQGDVVTYDDGTPPNKTVPLEEGGSVQVTVSGVSPEVTLKEVTRGNCSTPLAATARVTVNANPPTLTLTPGPPVCAGDHAIFTIEGGNKDDVVIYDDGTSTRTIPIRADGKATVPVNGVSSNTTLTLKEVSNENCSIELSEMATVTVNDLPVAPTVSSSPVEYCVDETATALTAIGDNLLWYTSEKGGTGEATAPIPGTAIAGSTTHYVSQTTNGCESDRAEIEVTVVEACLVQIGDGFTVSGIDYEITSVNPNEVEVVDYSGSATEVEIPGTVDDKGETYTVTAIGANAFSDNPDLSTVKIEADHLLSIHADAFADRSQVDLVVSTGMRQAYIDAGLTGFASITEAQVVTAINNYEFKDVTLYPNPARDKVYIDLGPGQELKQVNIRTMAGAYLYSENRLEINTTRLPRGLYLFEIVTKKGDRSMRRVNIQ